MQRPKVKSPFFLAKDFTKYLSFILDFEKLVRGMKKYLCFSLICGKSVGDSRNLMKPFSLPYECIFHLVCIMLSANAQFSHTKACVLFG